MGGSVALTVGRPCIRGSTQRFFDGEPRPGRRRSARSRSSYGVWPGRRRDFQRSACSPCSEQEALRHTSKTFFKHTHTPQTRSPPRKPMPFVLCLPKGGLWASDCFWRARRLAQIKKPAKLPSATQLLGNSPNIARRLLPRAIHRSNSMPAGQVRPECPICLSWLHIRTSSATFGSMRKALR